MSCSSFAFIVLGLPLCTFAMNASSGASGTKVCSFTGRGHCICNCDWANKRSCESKHDDGSCRFKCCCWDPFSGRRRTPSPPRRRRAPSPPRRRRAPSPAPRRRTPSPTPRRRAPGPAPSPLKCHSTADHHLEVSWTDDYTHDYYEVHLASSEHGESFGAMATAEKSVTIKEVLPGHTYWVKKRSHAPHGTLDTAWTSFSHSVECKVGGSAGGNSSLFDDINVGGVASLGLHVVRESRGDSPDYLQEHNAANLDGEASFLKNHAHTPVSQLSLHCIDIVNVKVPGVTTTGGDTRFANYASCRKPQNTGSYKCSEINDADCQWLRLSDANCKAARGSKSWDYSKKYVGKGYRKSTCCGTYELYSFPAASECKAGMKLGDKGCTWKRQSFFRMTRGHTGMTAAAMKKAFEDAPLQKNSCGGNLGVVGAQVVLV